MIRAARRARPLRAPTADPSLPPFHQLAALRLDAMVHSPLSRAAETAHIIWNGREGGKRKTPLLREIDLHSFEGLLKADAPSLRPAEYAAWQTDPASFTLDGAAPVVDLWARAVEAWADLLPPPPAPPPPASQLVVAHNAINQALVATAVGLPPTAFRRLSQGNGSVTTLAFPTPATVTVRGFNIKADLFLGPRPPWEGGTGDGLVVWLAVDPHNPAPLPLALVGLAPTVLLQDDRVSKSVAVAVAAATAAAGVDAAADVWRAAAAAASTGRSPVVLALAPPSMVRAALAAAAGAAGTPFAADVGSVSVVEVRAGDSTGARAILRTTNWGEAPWGGV